VVRHADETILVSGISSLRAFKSVIAEQYDSHGNLGSSQRIDCPSHPFVNAYRSRNEFSKILCSDSNPSITAVNYRFSSANQRPTNANFHYHTATRTLTSSTRRCRISLTNEHSKNDVNILDSMVSQYIHRTCFLSPTKTVPFQTPLRYSMALTGSSETTLMTRSMNSTIGKTRYLLLMRHQSSAALIWPFMANLTTVSGTGMKI
jgi:hypothetical protein